MDRGLKPSDPTGKRRPGLGFRKTWANERCWKGSDGILAKPKTESRQLLFLRRVLTRGEKEPKSKEEI